MGGGGNTVTLSSIPLSRRHLESGLPSYRNLDVHHHRKEEGKEDPMEGKAQQGSVPALVGMVVSRDSLIRVHLWRGGLTDWGRSKSLWQWGAGRK